MSYKQELDRYYSQVKVCPECGKKWAMKDWPVMPSNKKPKRTCCLAVGWNNKRKYEDRRKIADGIEKWLCLKCKSHKPSSEFYKSYGRINSGCKECHSKRYAGYKSFSDKKALAETKKRRITRDNEIIECRRCGNNIKRKYWPKQTSGKLAGVCCTEKTTAQINRSLRKKGKRFCGSCDQVLDMSEFWARSDGKLVNPCKKCRKINGAKNTGSTEKRQTAIELTSDGSLTKSVIRDLFISQTHCLICQSEMRFEDKTMDHVMPLSKGGAHSLSNVIIMCHSCNSSKNAKSPSEWFKNLLQDQKDRIMDQKHLDLGVFK